MLKHKLHSRIDLLAFATCRFDESDKRLYEFVLNSGDKKLNDLIHLVWEMETAKEKQERSTLTRLDILRQQVNIQCICNGQWLDCALDILDRNAIDRVGFADAIVTLLQSLPKVWNEVQIFHTFQYLASPLPRSMLCYCRILLVSCRNRSV